MLGDFITTAHIIIVLINGYQVNVENIYRLEEVDGGRQCVVKQYYNPPTIYANESCDSIREKIVDALTREEG